MSKIGEILADLRKDRNISQKEFASIFHVSSSTISSYEIGAHLPNAEQIIQFSDYFNVSADYLLGRVSCEYPVDIFEETFIDDKSLKDVVATLRSLPDEHRRAMMLLLNEISFAVSTREHAAHTAKKR